MIQPPNWCKDAIPTARGWEYKGELVKAGKLTGQQISEYNSSRGVGLLQEAPSNKSLDNMTPHEVQELTSHHNLDEVDETDSVWTRVKGTLLS